VLSLVDRLLLNFGKIKLKAYMSPTFILILVLAGAGLLVSWIMKSRFTSYSKILLASGLSGKQVAEKMLRENGIYDVSVVSVEGILSDHYDPTKRTVNLSHDVYNGISVAAAAVAAHECGHAIQHATAYQWLTLRSRLVPVVQFSASWVQWILIGGILLINTFPTLLLGGIILFGLITLFSVVTLPVEFDASRRALSWLSQTNVTSQNEYPKAKNALWWAAMTYVVAAVSSVATLLHYLSIYQSRDND